MPSTYTVNLGIEKPATGEQSGTWGDTTNINFDLLDQAINGCLSLTLASAGTSGSPNTLAISDGATSDGRNKWIEFVDGGDLGATAYVQLTPNDAEKIVFIRNSLSGSRSVILFQGTYDAGRDLEVPAGVDMVVKFSGGGATATTTDIFTKLRATEITTPTLTTDDLTAGTADINDGTVEAVIGGTTPKAGTFTNLTANTDLSLATGATVTGINTTTNMSDASATTLATSLSIKTYVDDQVATVDTLAEVLANGNTSGANNLIIDSGQALTANTINETTAGSGVTIDSVLLKDDGVNATNLEITNIKANDGTAAGSIADSTGAFTINSFISNSVNIGGGAIDDTTIGASTASSGAFTTLNTTGVLTVDAEAISVIKSGIASDILRLQNDAGSYVFGYASSIASVDLGASDVMRWRHSSTESFRTTASGPVVNEVSNASVDFRVESDSNTHMFFVDASGNQIGINTTTLNTYTQTTAVGNTKAEYNATQWASFSGAQDGSGMLAQNLFRWHDGSTTRTSYVNSHGSIGGAGVLVGSPWNAGALVATDTAGTAGAEATDLQTQLSWRQGFLTINTDGEDVDFRVESVGNSNMIGLDAANNVLGIGKFGSTAGATTKGAYFNDSASNFFHFVVTHENTTVGNAVAYFNRQSSDGNLIEFRQADSAEGTISVSGSTVSYNGFSGRHESSGIPTTTVKGTVVSTIDELDTYLAGPKQGQTRADHAKVKISDTAGESCVYGVVDDFDENGKVNVISVGIAAVRVTGACGKGDLLESNGDGTAKVQSDDIVRSKTLGKVTIGNSDTGVKLVSCVMYCG